MNYNHIWKKVLLEDEKIEHEFSMGSQYIILGFMIFTGISIFLFFLEYRLGILIFISALFYFLFYLKIANVYAFTNKRVLIHRGWLSTNMTSVEYSKITDTHVEEPFIYKIFTQTGSLFINTAGTPNIEIILLHIERPYDLKKILDNLINNKKV